MATTFLAISERGMVRVPIPAPISRMVSLTEGSALRIILSKIEELFTVPKGAFLPPPRVSSAVVKLTPKKDVKLDEFMLNITRALFQHKRKKAKKALLDSYHEWAPDKKFAKEMLSRLDSELMDERPFQMESENIIQITHELKKLIKSD